MVVSRVVAAAAAADDERPSSNANDSVVGAYCACSGTHLLPDIRYSRKSSLLLLVKLSSLVLVTEYNSNLGVSYLAGTTTPFVRRA